MCAALALVSSSLSMVAHAVHSLAQHTQVIACLCVCMFRQHDGITSAILVGAQVLRCAPAAAQQELWGPFVAAVWPWTMWHHHAIRCTPQQPNKKQSAVPCFGQGRQTMTVHSMSKTTAMARQAGGLVSILC